MSIRSRIKGHKKVRAGDLVPHELNPRTHSEAQRQALQSLLEEIGFARSVLAYELPDGRLKLIDGHLRQSMDPDEILEVEVLDVSDEEARKLILAIDPLAQLAGFDVEILSKLQESVSSPAVENLWNSVAAAEIQTRRTIEKAVRQNRKKEIGQEQYLILIECEDEAEQLALLRRFKQEGLSVSAKIA